MEIVAKSSVRVAPRKVRLVADAIRALTLDEALNSLSVTKNRGAASLQKTLKSAVANAINNNKVDRSLLTIKSITVNEATSYKRYHPSTRGRVHMYKRRGSRINIVLESKEEVKEEVKKEVKTKERKEK